MAETYLNQQIAQFELLLNAATPAYQYDRAWWKTKFRRVPWDAPEFVDAQRVFRSYAFRIVGQERMDLDAAPSGSLARWHLASAVALRVYYPLGQQADVFRYYSDADALTIREIIEDPANRIAGGKIMFATIETRTETAVSEDVRMVEHTIAIQHMEEA
ncbi:MAG: hypothetical protein C4523_19720 [Myxococcales bacterium]|nr:MAG: hypothetical protein C4523_19720 [Myxococcales bacterium]